MTKNTWRFFILFILACLLGLGAGTIFCVETQETFINTIYQVSGIVFAIGMGLIVSFDLGGITTQSRIKSIRKNIYSVRNSFIIYFMTSTIVYVLYNYIPMRSYVIYNKFNIVFDFSWIAAIFILLSIIYFVLNFSAIQKLKEDILDRLNEEKQNKKEI